MHTNNYLERALLGRRPAELPDGGHSPHLHSSLWRQLFSLTYHTPKGMFVLDSECSNNQVQKVLEFKCWSILETFYLMDKQTKISMLKIITFYHHTVE